MEIGEESRDNPGNDCSFRILQYMGRYPNFYFRSSRIAKKTGISPQKASKVLLDLHREGHLIRITVGKSRIKPYYRLKS